jgi:hypothetical protein
MFPVLAALVAVTLLPMPTSFCWGAFPPRPTLPLWWYWWWSRQRFPSSVVLVVLVLITALVVFLLGS